MQPQYITTYYFSKKYLGQGGLQAMFEHDRDVSR